MDFTQQAMEYMVGLGKVRGQIIDARGGKLLVSADGIKEILPVNEPACACMETYTLQGLVDFVSQDVDDIFDNSAQFILSVGNHETVTLYSRVHGLNLQRDELVICKAHVPAIPFDRYMPNEEFIIMLMTRFLEDENRQKVLALVSNLSIEQSMNTADDGISQRVTVKKGVATVGDTIIRNPVVLTPRRTFCEARQPASPFILRLADGNKVGLFEADGGFWKSVAVANIKMWLADKLADKPNIHIIA